MRKFLLATVVALAGVAGVTVSAGAEALPEFHVQLQNHEFTPASLKVPAHTKIKVLVTNHNPTPSEFESTDFNREKIVLPNSTITVFIGPLGKGTYRFFDDFHQATTGILIVE